MITYVKGNMFESPAKVLVNTVNTVGVMGKGIAKTFKEIYPEMFSQYQRLCENQQLGVGNLWLYKTSHKWILNFPTKRHWRQPSRQDYIEMGLKKFLAIYSTQRITSIAFPKLGCGNGELDWEQVVQPLMLKYLRKLPINIFIYAFDQSLTPPEHKDVKIMHEWLRNEPRVLAFTEVWDDLCSLVGSSLTLTTSDRIAKFNVTVTSQPENGLLIQVGSKTVWQRLVNMLAAWVGYPKRPRVLRSGDIFIPQDAMLDLWQNIRSYGFCVPRVMPSGLDLLEAYVMPLMAGLDYMRPVELARITKQMNGTTEPALQLFASQMNHVKSPSEPVYAVRMM